MIATISEPKHLALEKYEEYRNLLGKRDEPFLKVLKDSYMHLSRGRQILNIYDVFETAGVNKFYQPRLAIAPAHFEEIIFQHGSRGCGYFGYYGGKWGHFRVRTILPKGTFSNISADIHKGNEDFITSTPIIPAQYIPKGRLNRYWLLWEVEKWEERSRPGDPLLLAKLSKNIFAVLAHWDLTPLERAILR